mgnify:CR=1 FL=1
MSKNSKPFHKIHGVYLYIGLVAIMSSIFGFNLGSLVSIKVRLINVFMLEIYNFDSIFSTFLLGMFVGVFLGGRLAYETGRVLTILGSFGVGVLGLSTSILAPTFSTLFIAEFAVGVCFGTYLLTALCYITEIAPAAHRGQCCSLLGSFLTLGVIIAIFLKDVIPTNGIVLVSIMTGMVLILLMVAYLILPESPRWLALTDASDKALNVLIRLRLNTAEAAKELAAINESVLGEERGVSLFFRNSVYRSLLWFMLFVVISAHFAGMSILPYESMELIRTFDAAVGKKIYYGVNEVDFDILRIALLVAFIANLLVFFLIDKVGRKKLLTVTSILNVISILIMYLLNLTLLPGFGPAVVAISILLFVFCSVIFANTFLFAVVPELLPAKGRELGLTLILLANVAFLMIGIYFFDNTLHHAGILKLLSLFLLAGAVLFSLIYQGLPESAHQMLESMENVIFNARSLRALNKKK